MVIRMSDRKLAPERRIQIVVVMHPDSKARLERCAEYFRNQNPSTILEGLAHHFEESMLATERAPDDPRSVLTDAQRRRYLAGKLNGGELVGKPWLRGPVGTRLGLGVKSIPELKDRADRDERAQLSMWITPDARKKLKRYCITSQVNVAYILDRHGRTMERHILAKLGSDEERQRFLAGEWKRELPPDLMTEAFNSNDNAAPEAAE